MHFKRKYLNSLLDILVLCFLNNGRRVKKHHKYKVFFIYFFGMASLKGL